MAAILPCSLIIGLSSMPYWLAGESHPT